MTLCSRRAFAGGLRAALLLGAAACGSDPSGPPALTLGPVSGDGQQVTVATAALPFVVRVADAADQPVAGAVVHWSVVAGVGSVTAADTSDALGQASGTFTAGSVAGSVKVRAEADGAAQLFTVTVVGGAAASLLVVSGDEQGGTAGAALAQPLRVRALDAYGNPAPGDTIDWSVVTGGGSLDPATVVTGSDGTAGVSRILGAAVGGQSVRAVSRAGGDTVLFHQTARGGFTTLAGGGNVPARYTSDLWVAGGYAYTGTWGFRSATGNVLYVWDVSSGVVLVDSVVVDSVGTISDDEVSADGTLLLVTGEYGARSGLFVYSLADPAHPALVGFERLGGNGLHTGTFADIDGERYVFAARDPGAPALMVYRIQPDSADPIAPVATVGQPANYGIHDTYVREGLAFVSDWNTGLRIYDVGDGRAGGSPAAPQLVGSVVTSSSGLSCNCVHNAWWYHAPDGDRRYVFVGQEGPGSVGSSSSGDIHVVDVSDMAHPEEVARYHLGGAGTHNFWVDESRGILYAAYYNGGVVALDITGTLRGDLAAREIARIQPGGAGSTYVWGVMLSGGALWASDMLGGLWKLGVP